MAQATDIAEAPGRDDLVADGTSTVSDAGNGLTPADSSAGISPIAKPKQTRSKVIKFSSVSKRFVLHHERARSFQDIVVSLFGLRSPSKRGVALPQPANQIFWALRDANFGIYAGRSSGHCWRERLRQIHDAQAYFANTGADIRQCLGERQGICTS